tara:strand:+ start:265 stop:495 length:231 start_codon:yes stop_codon:yes gene_type:complete
MNIKEKELKAEIDNLRKEKNECSRKLDIALKKCQHNFIYGYVADVVVFCEICGLDADTIYPNMPLKHIEKLVVNEK